MKCTRCNAEIPDLQEMTSHYWEFHPEVFGKRSYQKKSEMEKIKKHLEAMRQEILKRTH